MSGSAQSLDKVLRRLQQVEDDILQNQLQDAAQVRRTHRFMQTMVAALAVVALVNLYFVGELAQEIELLIRNMDRSVVHLEEMGDRTTGMQLHFERIGESAGRLPIVVDQMVSISAGMQEIERDLGGIREGMQHMSDHVAEMDGDVDVMKSAFRQVNGKLVHIRHSMAQMSGVLP
jgi:hypothetical protein